MNTLADRADRICRYARRARSFNTWLVALIWAWETDPKVIKRGAFHQAVRYNNGDFVSHLRRWRYKRKNCDPQIALVHAMVMFSTPP